MIHVTAQGPVNYAEMEMARVRRKAQYVPYLGLTTRWHMSEFLRSMSSTGATEETVRAGQYDRFVWFWLYPEADGIDPEDGIAFMKDPTVRFGADRARLEVRTVATGGTNVVIQINGVVQHVYSHHSDPGEAVSAMLAAWRALR